MFIRTLQFLSGNSLSEFLSATAFRELETPAPAVFCRSALESVGGVRGAGVGLEDARPAAVHQQPAPGAGGGADAGQGGG